MTPLGERGRGHRWGTTVAWYVVGSTFGGAAVGTALGVLGRLLTSVASSSLAAPIALAAGLAAGAALDVGPGRSRLPTPRRQVNEEWLSRYRGWVYGLGFGVQLGAGFLTVVSTSAVYGAFLAALLGGSIAGGLAVGTAFGLARGLSILSVARVRTREQLLAVDARLGQWNRPARTATVAAQALVAVALLAAVR